VHRPSSAAPGTGAGVVARPRTGTLAFAAATGLAAVTLLGVARY
jgi:hypothetical protein